MNSRNLFFSESPTYRRCEDHQSGPSGDSEIKECFKNGGDAKNTQH